MPRPVSGVRVARSVVTPAGAQVVTREIDFQLSPQMGIEIYSVMGSVNDLVVTESTASQNLDAVQTLHLETGSLETVAVVAADDEDTTDSEIFYRQDLSIYVQEEAATRGGSHSSLLLVPLNSEAYSPTLFAARNITHRGESVGANLVSVTFIVTMRYRFVVFSLSELGLILARRT